MNSNTVHHSQNVETTQLSMNRWTDKYTVTCPTTKYYSALKGMNTDTCYNMNKCWKHYAKWKKPDQKKKSHLLYYLRLYETSRTGKSIKTERRLVDEIGKWPLTSFHLGGWKYSGIGQSWQKHNSANILKTIELYILKW